MSQVADPTSIFEVSESAVRTYSRSFPAVFSHASGDHLITEDGTRYLDFLAGAGSMNYGHNPGFIKRILVDYLENDGLTNALDLATTAKRDFLGALVQHVLTPRGLDYKVQFCGPTGTNAVEAALKVARLATGRANVVSFSGGFHGVSTGSLAATSAGYYKQGLHATLSSTTTIPYPDSPLGAFNSLDLLNRMVDDPSSGMEKPAAVLLETIQGEGGVYVTPVEFLTGLREWCDKHQVLLIVDDIQAGCGRAGTFFSFERAGIKPDLVTLSKSISAYGLPMAILLMRPEYDIWQPGQHNGTFRGNQLAFVAATAALREYWADDAFATEVQGKGVLVAEFLERHVASKFDVKVRGMGLIWGIDMTGSGISAAKVSKLCFDRGLIVEACGRDSEVVKILPPLTVSEKTLTEGLELIVEALYDLTGESPAVLAEGTS
jgi:diaminobutyrate-2-oxoglutarate transaminase